MRFKFNRRKSTTTVKPPPNLLSAKTSPLDISKLHFKEGCERKMKSLLYKIIWDLGLSCFYPSYQEKECSVKKSIENYKAEEDNWEQNKAWLLAESGGCSGESDNTEPHSLHSSFRFSFCSQVEVETIKANISPSATVLMVNLENGLMDPFVGQVKWKRTQSLERSISTLTHTLIRFSYAEIVSASCNFSKGRFLGRGALSYVFRGRIGILRTSVAIKRLHKNDNESSKAFCRELMIASSLHNPHIVPLVGFCIDPKEGFFLVYKCVSGGNLGQYLHEKKNGVKSGLALPWSVRYKVAVGIAEAIKYLHNGTDRCIVHRDIKPSNILISSKKSAKLCDFGLAAWTSAPSVPFHCKTVKGTFGYLAPEYFQHGKVSDKNDVYAFGVVLLEIITGRMPIELKRGPGEENLVVWAKPLLQQGCTEKLLDPQLKHTKKNFSQITRMVETANACINNEECQRPNADEIIAMLRGGEPNFLGKTKATLAASMHHQQSHLTKTDIKTHIALAMVGVSGLEDDEHMYCR